MGRNRDSNKSLAAAYYFSRPMLDVPVCNGREDYLSLSMYIYIYS
jgi:hypothetical protein